MKVKEMITFTEHMDKLQTVAGVLLEKEKIDGDEFEAIFA